jgi:hypothetical protein
VSESPHRRDHFAAAAVRQLSGRTRALVGARAADDFTTWLARIAVAVGGLNVVVLLVQARSTIHQLELNADYSMSLVLPALSGHAPAGSVITLGNHPFYEAWWFERATIGLPHFRFIWEAAPFVVEAAGIALVAWCAWVAVGGLATILSGVALVSISDGWRGVLAMSGGRVGLAFHAGALCAALLIICAAARAPRLSRPLLAVFTVFTVIFAAAAATDYLILATVLVPYIVAPLLWWGYERSTAARNVALYAVATGLASIVGGALLVALMQGEHVIGSPYPVVFTAAASLATNLQNLISGWAGLGDGAFFGLAAHGVDDLLTFIAGALCLAALGGVVWALGRRVYAVLAGPGPRRVVSPARFLYVSFWGLVLATNVGLYLLTTVSNSPGIGDHYLLSAWIAVAALLGAFARRKRLVATLLVGVALFGAFNARTHIADGVPAFGSSPSTQVAGEIEHFAKAHGATIGYGEYWDAASVTWETRLDTQVYPLAVCGQPPSGLCPFYISISSWYTPRKGVRTYLLTDSRTTVSSGIILTPPRGFGKPIAKAAFGPFGVFVYRYDLATRLGPG